jgi:hypothetical protein
MASGNHILALTGHQPELAELLREYGNASILADPSVEQLADRLKYLFGQFSSGQLKQAGVSPLVAEFSRQRQTAELARLLDIAVNCPKSVRSSGQPFAKPGIVPAEYDAEVA